MEEYYKVLYAFCALNADLAKTYEELSLGVCPDEEFLTLLERFEYIKNLLLEIKESLELKGGLSFLEDFSFDTGNPLEKENAKPVFGIKDGLFFGDRQKALDVICKWRDESTEEDIRKNPYKYEKAIYLLNMLFDGNDEYGKENTE